MTSSRKKQSLFCWYYTILVVLFVISFLFHVSGPNNNKKTIFSLQVTQVSPRAVNKKQNVKYLDETAFSCTKHTGLFFYRIFPTKRFTIGKIKIDTKYSENWMKIHTIPASMASEDFKYVT